MAIRDSSCISSQMKFVNKVNEVIIVLILLPPP